MPSRRKPKPGDLVEVIWVDHATGGDSTKHDCPVLVESGYFLAVKKIHGRDCLVTTKCKLKHGESGWDMGWNSYPMCAVLGVEVV